MFVWSLRIDVPNVTMKGVNSGGGPLVAMLRPPWLRNEMGCFSSEPMKRLWVKLFVSERGCSQWILNCENCWERRAIEIYGPSEYTTNRTTTTGWRQAYKQRLTKLQKMPDGRRSK